MYINIHKAVTVELILLLPKLPDYYAYNIK